MDMQVTTYPDTSFLPVDLAELKRFLRIEFDTEDNDLKHVMLAAAQQFTKLTGREVLTTTRRLAVPLADMVELPYPNLLSVTSVKYYDTDNVLQTIAPGDYTVDAACMPGRVILDTTPSVSTDYSYPLVISYACGFGSAAGDYPVCVPASVRHWIKECVRWMYEAKEVPSATVGLPPYLIALADSWKLGTIWSGLSD